MEKKITPMYFRDDLKKFIGKRVIKLIRYSWWPKKDIPAECGVSKELAFSFTAGPLEVIFEDESSLGLASDPSLNSVIVWRERESGGGSCVISSLSADAELYPVDSDDEEYSSLVWRGLSGRQLIGFSILKKRAPSSLESELPSELGLSFNFEENVRFIASHGLHDGSDDFSVFMPNHLKEAQVDQLVEVCL